ncbi:RlpA-like double-psi beta-barrel-protein domain-containing protein-containing protein [Schizophyllum amplum]|uniref:RlpA-like double-psi beta-barrel-protein domain-containing protein-containing protein n=1 Tax=Schizophyllum amplum TaxID=97359 RepID=A0A550CNI0_9AGAR|nr:RlpA-like double-psi beta-barrel-protein domain-containing protein-containing protein [Auriculariopsis ampla]
MLQHSFIRLCILFSLFLCVVAKHGVPGRHGLTKLRSLSEASAKRDTNARFTNYVAGLGACGSYNSDSEFVVALNIPQFAGGAHCGETITITANGKTTTALVADECMECPYGAVDFSTGLFTFFADPSVGVLYGDWSFGNAAETTTSTSVPPETTAEPTTTTTRTHTRTHTPTFTSTSSATWSSSSSSSSVSSSSSSSIAASTTSIAFTSATPTPSATGAQGTVGQLQLAVQQFGRMMVVAADAS